jgi:hypothetical protein
LEALYASEVVREAFTSLFKRDDSSVIFPVSDGSYYAGPSNPHFVKMVQDHDRETRARFDRETRSWAEGVVVSADSELNAY